MKPLLAAVVLLPLAALALGRAAFPVASLDDPPPIECPFCGGNAALHGQVLTALTATQAEIARRVLVASRQ